MPTSTRPTHRWLAQRAAAALALALAATSLVALPVAAFEPLEDVTTGGGAAGLDVTPDGTTAYVVDRDVDTITVVDLITMSPVTTITTLNEPIGLVISPDGSQGIVTHAGTPHVLFFDTATNSVLGTSVEVGAWPFDAAFTADGSKAWVTNYIGQSISIIDVATRTVDTTFAVPGLIEGITLSPDESVFWVSNTAGGVFAFDVATHAKIGEVTVSGFITDVVLSPDGTRGYAPNNSAPEIHVLDTSDPTAPAVVDTIPLPANGVAIDISPDGEALYVTMWEPSSAASAGRVTIATEDVDVVPDLGDAAGVVALPSGNGALVADDPEVLLYLADPVIRLSGSNRYNTAVEISQEGFPGGADVVYVSTGLAFPDALAAGPAAAFGNGPVLLTDPVAMPAQVRAEIVRLDPDRIVVVGGTDRVSAAILADLNTIAPADRIQGANRFETSRDIALDAFGLASSGGGADAVYIATGLNFPDALAAGAAGASFGSPVLLVNGTQSTVDQATLDTIADLGAVNIYVVGGPNMVSDGIVDQLGATRISGADRYATAYEINRAVFGADSARRAIIATGLAFPDALAASALAGQIKAPLFLAPTSCVPAAVLSELTLLGVTQVTLVGGPDRLTQSVFDLTSC